MFTSKSAFQKFTQNLLKIREMFLIFVFVRIRKEPIFNFFPQFFVQNSGNCDTHTTMAPSKEPCCLTANKMAAEEISILAFRFRSCTTGHNHLSKGKAVQLQSVMQQWKKSCNYTTNLSDKNYMTLRSPRVIRLPCR